MTTTWRLVPTVLVVAATLLVTPGAAAQTSSLTTGFQDDGGWCAGPFMDITATTNLTISSFAMYFKGTLNRNVSVYYKAGSYIGSEGTPAAWTLLGTVNVTPAGSGSATTVNLGGVSIPAGQTYGFHVWDNLGTGGTEGGGLILKSNPPTYSNADMTLTTYYYTCDSAFGTASNAWGWQGTVYYALGNGQGIPTLGPEALVGLAAVVLLLGWFILRQRSVA